MPIRPEERARYPKDWPRISRFIREDRAGGRCECIGQCGNDHGNGFAVGRCTAENRSPHPVTGSIVVLTTAHMDHTPENCGADTLRAMCQRCHLAYDREHHRQTRRNRRACGDLFDAGDAAE